MSTTGKPHVSMNIPPLKSAALQYARIRWRVFPVHAVCDGICTCGKSDCSKPGKHPRTEHGFKDASVEEAKIRAWWTRWPDANVGIVTGEIAGIVVIDIDPRNGGNDSFAVLEKNYGAFPATVEVLSILDSRFIA